MAKILFYFVFTMWTSKYTGFNNYGLDKVFNNEFYLFFHQKVDNKKYTSLSLLLITITSNDHTIFVNVDFDLFRWKKSLFFWKFLGILYKMCPYTWFFFNVESMTSNCHTPNCHTFFPNCHTFLYGTFLVNVPKLSHLFEVLFIVWQFEC